MDSGFRTRVARFAGEFTVIVLGVLVALFMESAWEDRQEGRLAAEYLERLRQEAVLNREQLTLDMGFHEDNCRSAEAALAGLSGRSQPPPEALLRAIWAAALNRASGYRTSTYEDLVASGRLGIIREPELRDRIIEFYEYDLDTWRPSRDAEYRRNVLRVLPPEWTTAMVSTCATMGGFVEGLDECWVPLEAGPAAWIPRVAAIPGIQEQLADRIYSSCGFPRFLSEADSALAALEAALGGSGAPRN